MKKIVLILALAVLLFVCRAEIVYAIALESGFDPDANGSINSIVVQEDGRILTGGFFTAIGGTVRNNIARLNEDGSLDPAFDPDANGSISSMAVQADGKILIAGEFTTIGGTPRNYIARLNDDGSLDTAFDPDANSSVFSIAVQEDRKILIVGLFTTISGTPRNYIARLNEDGSLDAQFDPDANDAVFSMAVQADGKILIGGNFTSIGGVPSNYMTRLNEDGGPDVTFSSDVNSLVFSMAVQADGKILIGGEFNAVDATTRNYMARLNEDGSLDAAFDPDPNGSVFSMAVQADGKILIGGYFTTIGGTGRNYIARLNENGSLDAQFDPDANDAIFSMAVQTDEKILIGGYFTTIGGTPRNCIARLTGYKLIVIKAGTGHGTITGTGIDCGSDCSENYDEITAITLTAISDTDSIFEGWSGDCDTDGQVTVDSVQTCTATFESCTYNILPSSDGFSRIGGIGSIDVTTQSGCAWTAVSNDSWITITSGSSGTGNDTVTYSVSFNSDPSSRDGTLTIAGNTFNISQSQDITAFTDPFENLDYADQWDVSSSGDVEMTIKKSALSVVIDKPLEGCSYADLTSKETFNGENLLVETGVTLKGYGEVLLRLKKDDNNYVEFGITGVVDKIPSFIMGSSEDGTYTEQTLNLSAEYAVKKKYKYKTFSIVKIGDEYRAYLNGMETGGTVTNTLLGDEGLKVEILNRVCSTDSKGAKNYFDYVFVSETIDDSILATDLKLLAPDGGEVINTGSVYLVLWERLEGASYYSIDYSANGGLKWKLLDSGIEGNFYTWKLIKEKPNSMYRLRINAHDSLGNIIDSDESGSNFTIQY